MYRGHLAEVTIGTMVNVEASALGLAKQPIVPLANGSELFGSGHFRPESWLMSCNAGAGALGLADAGKTCSSYSTVSRQRFRN